MTIVVEALRGVTLEIHRDSDGEVEIYTGDQAAYLNDKQLEKLIAALQRVLADPA